MIEIRQGDGAMLIVHRQFTWPAAVLASFANGAVFALLSIFASCTPLAEAVQHGALGAAAFFLTYVSVARGHRVQISVDPRNVRAVHDLWGIPVRTRRLAEPVDVFVEMSMLGFLYRLRTTNAQGSSITLLSSLSQRDAKVVASGVEGFFKSLSGMGL